MRIWHPEHGYHHVASVMELEQHEKLGWSIDQMTIEERKAQKPKDEDVTTQNIETVRALWERKFGKKPHHMKRLDTLLKELE